MKKLSKITFINSAALLLVTIFLLSACSNTDNSNNSQAPIVLGDPLAFGAHYCGNDTANYSTNADVQVRITNLGSLPTSQTGMFEFNLVAKAAGDYTQYYIANSESTPAQASNCWQTLPTKTADGWAFDQTYDTYDGTNALTVYLKNSAGKIASGAVTFALHVPPNYDSTTADPLLPYQWHLSNIGQTFANGVSAYNGQQSDANVKPAHQSGFVGRGVLVAVLDSGVQMSHEDLHTSPLNSWNLINLTHDPTPTSNCLEGKGGASGYYSHGTAVAGIIAARAGNSKGGVGVAPSAILSAVNVINPCYDNGSYEDYILSVGLLDATISTNPTKIAAGSLVGKAQVYNQSYGFESITEPMSALELEFYRDLAEKGSKARNGLGNIYVKAAGNGFSYNQFNTDYNVGYLNSNFDPEKTDPYHIIVSAANSYNHSTSYTSTGSNVFINAPGGEFAFDATWGKLVDYAYYPAIVTTDLMGCSFGFSQGSPGKILDMYDSAGEPFSRVPHNQFEYQFVKTTDATGAVMRLIGPSPLNQGCNYTSVMNGTSSASPIVSGAVALMLSINPHLSLREVKYILSHTASHDNHVGGSYATTDTLIPYNVSRSSIDLPNNRYLFRSLSSTSLKIEDGWEPNHAATPLWFSNIYGFGLLDTSAAVQMAKTTIGKTDPFGLGTFQSLDVDPTNNSKAGFNTFTNNPTSDATYLSFTGPGGISKIEAVGVDVDLSSGPTGCKHNAESLGQFYCTLLVVQSPSNTRSIVFSPFSAFGSNKSLSNMPLLSYKFNDEPATTLTSNEWRLYAYNIDDTTDGYQITSATFHFYGH